MYIYKYIFQIKNISSIYIQESFNNHLIYAISLKITLVNFNLN